MTKLTEIEIAAITAAINSYIEQESGPSKSSSYLTPWQVTTFNNGDISSRRQLLGWTERSTK